MSLVALFWAAYVVVGVLVVLVAMVATDPDERNKR